MVAILYSSRSIINLLIKYGANVNASRTTDGKTALMLANSQGHLDIAQLLITAGANIETVRTDMKRKREKDD
jgi:ankyrin repeat protein